MSSVSDLSRLEPATFEHLVNAIALKVLGAGATGFGPGPDGGRDGWFEGEAPYPSARQRWKGVWYIQCKFHAPHLSKNPQRWLLDQLRTELAAFTDPRSGRSWPDNWIVATNIEPSGRAVRGTFDQARTLVKKARPELATRFHIWGGQKLCDFLADLPAVSRRYGHFLTPGHVISALIDQLGDERASVAEIVQFAVVRGIEDQRQTRLEQAGSSEDRPPGIEALFVDLPFAEDRCKSKGMALRALARASAANHRLQDEEHFPSSVTTLACEPEATGGDMGLHSVERWQTWRAHPCRAGVWFLRAGPGRGKSSIGQFFCQIQRAALILQKGVSVHPTQRALARRIQGKAASLECWPAVPRIPLWVELKAYAAWYGEQTTNIPHGIASYICATLQRTCETNVQVGTLRRAMSERSWVVVFDGLDEVPSDVRDAVGMEVVRFVQDTSTSGDLLAICTSRPQGYSGQFDALDAAVVDLIDLPSEIALECALKVAVIDRSEPDASRATALLQRAVESPAVKELLTTPLQAHIMAVLVRNGQRPPERKWDLYHKFYEVIREREANRELPDPILRELFQGDPTLIDAVHQRLGFALHARAETVTGADASLTKEEFEVLVKGVVQEARPASDVGPVVQALLRATTERLVLINTPDHGDRVRFDIRAIQEFFAAEFMYVDTPVEALRERLELVAADSHWREVVQFVLGALTALKRATEWTVAVDVLRSVDLGGDEGRQAQLARRLARGAIHAALLFENGAVEGNRKTRDQLRSVLDPFVDATDDTILQHLRRVSAPDSRKWIFSWAVEEVQRLRPGESRGALDILASLCHGTADDHPDLIELLNRIESGALGRLLSSIRIRRKLEGAGVYGWESHLEDQLLNRDDCVARAPQFVAELLWDASISLVDGSLQARYRADLMTVGSVGRVYSDLLGVYSVDVKEIGAARLMRAHVAGTAADVLRCHTSGLRGFLKDLYELTTERSVQRTCKTLAWMGETWKAVVPLPIEFAMALPLPDQISKVTPSEMARVIGELTDEEYASHLRAGVVGGIKVTPRVPYERIVRGDRKWLASPHAVDLVHEHPHAGVVHWCVSTSMPDVATDSPQERELHSELKEHAYMPSVQSAVAEAIVDSPYILRRIHPAYQFISLGALGEHIERVLNCLRTADVSWLLEVDEIEVKSDGFTLPLSLPRDRMFLPVVASAYLATVAALESRSAFGRSGRRAFQRYHALSLDKLQEVVMRTENPSNERAAALLLCAFHVDGGWPLLLKWRDEVLEFAAEGIPVASGAALAVEMTGDGKNGAALELISELIRARRQSSMLGRGGTEEQTLENVLRTWRERSNAPCTSAGSLQRWLDLPVDKV